MVRKTKEQARVAPLFLGPRNAEAAVGASWRWVRDWAGQMGVPTHRIGGKTLVDAVAFVEAVRRQNADMEAVRDPVAALRERLGLRRRTD